MKHFLQIISLLLLAPFVSYAQVAINTSFEDYTVGSIGGQSKWTTTGICNVSSDAYYIRTGGKGLQVLSDASVIKVDYVAYDGKVPGITGVVYADLYVKVKNLQTKAFSINGYDLFGGSQKRFFVVDFLDSSTSTGNIKVYSGSSGSNKGTYTKDQWKRISIMVNFSTEKYKVAIDGTVVDGEFDFRETYTPTASGTRQADIKEFHSLRFNHTSDTGTGTANIAIDDIYVGTNPIAGIDFGNTTAQWKITTNQPTVGSISFSPSQANYEDGTSVTATLNLPAGYKNAGWTGDLSGTELIKTFSITKNMTIGADVQIDETNPPAKYTITVNQPSNGTITLSPASADSKYYAYTKVTATISNSACYQFNGWTGSISGTSATNTFIVMSNMTVSADVTENTTPAETRAVQTTAQLTAALAAMNPGDIIELADGTYNISSLSVTRSGCENRPIIIRAKNQGMVKLTGKVAWALKNVEYITIEGLVIESSYVSSIFKLEGCNHVRITKNTLRMSKDSESQTSKWVLIGDVWDNEVCTSHHNRIDHNLFDGKQDGGAWVVIDGAHGNKPGDISKYDRIDHNYFRNNTPRVDNEKETIRLGVSDLSHSSAYCTVEYNLFEECDGDPEIVSVKSCDNIVRYNTFRKCLGTVCLRQGFRNVVEGNYFFGEGKTVDGIGCGGVRVYSLDHKIINNYFEGLTGEKWDATCTLTNGDVTNTSTSYDAHYIPENVVFAFNTCVNNKSDLEIGFDNNGKYGKSPKNCTVANNIFVNDANQIVKTYNTASPFAGVTLSNNIMYPTGTGSLGFTPSASQVTQVNPMLVQTNCRTYGDDCSHKLPNAVYKLQATSPAINAATGNYSDVTTDFEGQPRSSTKTIGADTYSNADITIGALSPEYVGPDAIDFQLIVDSDLPRNKFNKSLVNVSALSKESIRVDFTLKTPADVLIRIYDMKGILLENSSSSALEGLNEKILRLDCSEGLYLLELITNEYRATTKFILK